MPDKRGFGEHFDDISQGKQQTQSALNFYQSGPRKFTKADFSGLVPIQRVLNKESARKNLGGSYLSYSWRVSLLTVELLCLQRSSIVSRKLSIVSKKVAHPTKKAGPL